MMQLRSNDFDVLRHLIRYGFSTSACLLEHGYWGHITAAWRRIKQLKDSGYIIAWDWRMDRPDLLRCSREGHRLIKHEHETRDDLNEWELSFPRQWPNVREVDHEIGVQFLTAQAKKSDVSIHRILTERELHSKNFPEYFIRAGHRQYDDIPNDELQARVPDYVLYLENESKVAGEYEHSKKQNQAVADIVESYGHKLICPYNKISVWGRKPGFLKRWCWALPESSTHKETNLSPDTTKSDFPGELQDELTIIDDGASKIVKYPKKWAHFDIKGCQGCDQFSVYDSNDELQGSYEKGKNEFEALTQFDETQLLNPIAKESELLNYKTGVTSG